MDVALVWVCVWLSVVPLKVNCSVDSTVFCVALVAVLVVEVGNGAVVVLLEVDVPLDEDDVVVLAATDPAAVGEVCIWEDGTRPPAPPDCDDDDPPLEHSVVTPRSWKNSPINVSLSTRTPVHAWFTVPVRICNPWRHALEHVRPSLKSWTVQPGIGASQTAMQAVGKEAMG